VRQAPWAGVVRVAALPFRDDAGKSAVRGLAFRRWDAGPVVVLRVHSLALLDAQFAVALCKPDAVLFEA
jgi:hypothetical protein